MLLYNKNINNKIKNKYLKQYGGITMAVLLTGGAGYIGSHIAVEMINEGYDVVIADDLSNSKPDVLDRLFKITGVKIPFYKIDVANKTELEKVFDENDITAAVHLAGFKAVGESVQIPLKYYRNNLDTALTLLEVMEEKNVKKFVFSSSATVYGKPEKVPIDENMPRSCTNPYGRTKLMIEDILMDAHNADKNLSVILLRYFNPIGAHESGLIGEEPNGIPNNLVPYITQVAAGKLKQLSVFGDDYDTKDGTGVRDYIHVVDLAKGHVAAIKYLENHSGLEAVNLGTGIGYSVLDIVHSFEKVNGIKIPYKIAPRRSGDIAECYANPEKAFRLFGWKATKNLEDMCRDSWRWQKNAENIK